MWTLQRSRPGASLRALSMISLMGATFSCGGAGGDATPTTPAMNPGLPVSGRLVASLTTPNPDDGAIMASFAGGAIDSVTLGPGSTARLLVVQPSSSTARVILVAGAASALGQGGSVDVWVPDTRKAASYTARIEQAAARVTYVQRTLQGYAMHITVP